MTKSQQIWSSLQDEEYRREYAADVGTGLAFQIKLIREKNGWSQQRLANFVGSHQPTIHQWEDPDYGNHTLNSLKSLASAFDLGLMVKFVPFSELVHWNANLTPERLAPPSFDEEQVARRNDEEQVARRERVAASESTVSANLRIREARLTVGSSHTDLGEHLGAYLNDQAPTPRPGVKEREYGLVA